MRKIWEKYKGMSVQAKSAIWFAVCSILQKGISFITVPIFTRLLTAEQYGTYSLYLSWLQILTVITSLYLYHGVFNNAMVKFEKDRDVYISAMQGLTLSITTALFVIYLAAKNLWGTLLGLAPVFVILMFVEMAVTPALHFWSGRQRFEFKYKRLVAITLAKSALNPILGIIMVMIAAEKDLARVSSVVITEVIFCGSIMTLQFVRGKRFFHREYWKYALLLAIPLLPHYLSGMILNQGDRVMIDHMVGKSEVAFYSVAYNLGLLVQIFTRAISNSFTPWMYQKIKKNDFNGIARTVNFLLVIIGVIGLGLMLCSPELILIIGSSKYANAVYVIPPVAASVYFIFLYNLLAIPQFYYEKTKFLAVSSFIAAALNIGLNYEFIKLYGYIAAGYTTLACYVLYSFGHFQVSQKVLKECSVDSKLFDKQFIFGISVIVILAGIGSNLLFDYVIIRYALILVGFAVAYFKRKEVIGLINGIRKK